MGTKIITGKMPQIQVFNRDFIVSNELEIVHPFDRHDFERLEGIPKEADYTKGPAGPYDGIKHRWTWYEIVIT